MDIQIGIGIVMSIVYVVLINTIYKREYKGNDILFKRGSEWEYKENTNENKKDI